MHAPGKAHGIPGLGTYLLVLAATRLMALVLIGTLVGGREFTGDVSMHMTLVRSPWDRLLGHATRFGQHPPFLGLMEAIFALPASWFLEDFYALRISFIAYEVIAGAFFWLCLRDLAGSDHWRRTALALFLILPMGWMTSTVMAQDETLSAAFLTAACWLMIRQKPLAAVLVCGLGVLAAKIFLILPLGALLLLASPSIRWRAMVLGSAPLALIVIWITLLQPGDGSGGSLVSFIPEAYFGINAWVFLMYDLGLSPATARTASTALVLGGVIALILERIRRADPPSLASWPVLITVIMVWMVVAFYHVNPEYYEIFFPIALLVPSSGRKILGLVPLFSIPWSVNLFYGIHRALLNADSSDGRQVFVDIFGFTSPNGMLILYSLALWTNITVTLWALWSETARLKTT